MNPNLRKLLVLAAVLFSFVWVWAHYQPVKGDQVIRDNKGRKTGTLTRKQNGDFTVRDKRGRKLGTLTRERNGDYAIRDKWGRKVGTVENKR